MEQNRRSGTVRPRPARAPRHAAPTSRSAPRAARHAAPEPGRHRQPPALPLAARRAIAGILVLLASGSAAIGAARGEDDAHVSDAVVAPTAAVGRLAPAAPGAGRTPAPAAPSGTGPRARPFATGAPLTTGPTVPQRGTGRIVPVPVPGADTGGTGRVVTYSFEIEQGLGVDSAAAARTVGRTLRDPRGWQRQDAVRFVQLTPAELKKGKKPQLTISLVSPAKTDEMCKPLSTKGELSCANHDHAVLNFRRWATATPDYAGRLEDYRTYQINHEVGHELGHPHVDCAGPGRLAKVMQQQSKGLNGCKLNIHPTVTRG